MLNYSWEDESVGEIRDRQQRLEQTVEEWRQRFTQYHSYTEDEMFTMDGDPVFAVLDFWRYQYSALAGLTGSIAEYLVARALGIEKAENAMLWTGYDMSYRSKRIEVKATCYVHYWNRKRTSNQRTFSIEPSNDSYWTDKPDAEAKKKSRQNDLYVFCLNTNRDIENNDPLKIDFWDFYVVPTWKIDERCEKIGNPNQKTISLGVVRRLAGEPVKWLGLKSAVDTVIEGIDQRISDLDELRCGVLR